MTGKSPGENSKKNLGYFWVGGTFPPKVWKGGTWREKPFIGVEDPPRTHGHGNSWGGVEMQLEEIFESHEGMDIMPNCVPVSIHPEKPKKEQENKRILTMTSPKEKGVNRGSKQKPTGRGKSLRDVN